MGRRRANQGDIDVFPIFLMIILGPSIFGLGIYALCNGGSDWGIVFTIIGGIMVFILLVMAIFKIVELVRYELRWKRARSKAVRVSEPLKYPEYNVEYITQFEGAELNKETISKILKIELSRLNNDVVIGANHCTLRMVRASNGRVKMEIEQCHEYRTVERYVQENYVRTPIYSDTKLKVTKIEKSFKLKNSELEALESCGDEFISRFSYQIITFLNDATLVPSWYLKKSFGKWEREVEQMMRCADSDAERTKNAIDRHVQESLKGLNFQKNAVEKELQKLYKKRDGKHTVPDKLSEKIAVNEKRLNEIKEKITKYNALLEENKPTYEHNIKVYAEQRAKVKEVCDALRLQIKPLSTDVMNEDVGFINLAELQMMERQKIIGVYIIRNRDNGKCYVGQSKDVLRRINQHFKGTEPKNIIFAKDYYSAPENKRSSLFEIKVIPLETKDEMDLTEKNLIEEYEAFTNGYNGTAGNT